MEQHPIPQQISSYEFKLVGEMTLKQFLKAAAGILIAILINTTKIVVIFKWPLMLISAGAGLLLAFVPFEDRPLETWAMAFLKSIYSPTIYTYKKKNEDWLDLAMSKSSDEEKQSYESKNANVIFKQSVGQDMIQNYLKINGEDELAKTVTIAEEERKKIENETKDAKSGLENTTFMEDKKNKVDDVAVNEELKNEPVDLNLKREKLEATGEAVFGNIPMPDRPDIPNVIVGMATDVLGKIIDGVIVEIQDNHGNPTRVIKTNALGQFKISTPLADGRYLMLAEKEGYIFDRVNIDLDGKIVDPVRIIAHN
jgi:hypothetical protein